MRFALATRDDCASLKSIVKSRWLCAVAALLLALPVTAVAQTDAPNSTASDVTAESSSRDLPGDSPQTTPAESFDNPAVKIGRTILDDELHFLKAPFTVSAIPWDILLVGGTTALAASDADEQLLHQVPQSWHQTSLNISDGALYGSVGVVGGIYLTGLITKNEHEQEVGVRTAESVVDSVILYGAMKAIFARQRPYTGPGEGKFFAGNWTSGSFPSGHAMFTWTIASTVAHQYHSVPLDLLMYGLAGTVSTTRITAGQHFPSDVLVGSVLGYFIGDYVAHKQENVFHTRTSKFQRARNAVLEHIDIGVQ